MNKHLTLATLMIAALAFAATAQAAGTYWTDADAGDSDWATVGNWSDGVPTTSLDTVINNGGTVYITSNATSNDTGIGAQNQNGIDNIGPGLDGTVIQTAGTWTIPVGGGDNGFIIGLGSQVGIYLLQGGTINCGAVKNVNIGWNNSAAAGPSYIIQSNDATATYKKMMIAASGNGAKGYYEMNSTSTMTLASYEMLITTGGTGQEGVFTQTAGTVNITGTHATSGGVRMGLGAGGGGKAELHLNGGLFYNGNGRFDFANGAFVDITNGTLRVNYTAKNKPDGAGPWVLGSLTGIANSDWRSFGLAADAENTFFLSNGTSTDITAYKLLHKNISGNNDYTTPIALTENTYVYSDSDTLTLTSGSDITGAYNLKLGGAGDIVVSDPIAIGGMLAKDGAGTVTLDTTNTYTGMTAVVDGTLALGHATDTLADTGPVTVSGGTLDLGANSDTVGDVTLVGGSITSSTGVLTGASYDVRSGTISAKLGGIGALTKTTAGAATLSGTNTYTGMTSINAGALVLGKQTVFNGDLANVIPDNITVASGAALGLALAGSGSFDDTAIDTVLSQMGTSTATTGMKPGAQIGLDTTNVAGGIYTRSTAIANLSGGNSIGLAKLGAGTLVLDANNTYTGATTVYAGTLTAGASQPGAFGASPSLAFSEGSTGTVQLNGNDITISGLTTNGGKPVVENGAAAAAALTINNSTTITYAGVLQDGTGGGALALVKDGGGTLTLSGANTYSGGTVVNAGTLSASSDTNLGDPAGGITFNGTCTFGNAGGWTVGAGRTITLNEGANVTFNFGNATFAGPVVGGGGFGMNKSVQGNPGLNLTNTNNTFTGAMNLSDKGASGSASYTFNSLGDAPGAGIIKLGYGGQGANFYWGSGAIAPLVLNYRQFDIGGSSGSSIKNNNTASSHANTITIKTDLLVTGTGNRTLTLGGTNTGDNTFAGKIVDGTGAVISLTKADAGTWILSGDNTYSGTTTLTAGTLAIGASNNLGSGSATNGLVFNGGTLRITGTALTQMSDLTNSGTRGITYTAAKTVGLDIADATNTFTVDQVLNQTTGGFAKAGPGAVVLNQTNTYTGATTVSAGTLYVNGTHDASAGGNSSYSVTGTLGGNGQINTTADAVTVNSGGKLSPGTEAAPGTLTLNLGAAALNLSAAKGDNAGEFTFRLGSASDQIVLGTGTYLNLGTDTGDDLSLDWSDFTFIPGAGLAEGAYILIDADTNVAAGTALSTGAGLLTGAIGGGTGALSIADGQDLILTVSGLSTPGDANGDGVVDAADYITLKKNFGAGVGGGAAAGNFDDTGTVNWADLNILTSNIGPGSGAPQTAPEPATIGLLAIGALAVIRRRRKA